MSMVASKFITKQDELNMIIWYYLGHQMCLMDPGWVWTWMSPPKRNTRDLISPSALWQWWNPAIYPWKSLGFRDLNAMAQKKSAHTALAVKACLLGCKTETLNAQVTFVINIAGGPKTISHRAEITLVFSCFLDDFCVSEVKKVWRCNFGSFWEVFGNGKTDLGGFRQRKNGQKWQKQL